jgi:hypothetical protein
LDHERADERTSPTKDKWLSLAGIARDPYFEHMLFAILQLHENPSIEDLDASRRYKLFTALSDALALLAKGVREFLSAPDQPVALLNFISSSPSSFLNQVLIILQHVDVCIADVFACFAHRPLACSVQHAQGRDYHSSEQ